MIYDRQSNRQESSWYHIIIIIHHNCTILKNAFHMYHLTGIFLSITELKKHGWMTSLGSIQTKNSLVLKRKCKGQRCVGMLLQVLVRRWNMTLGKPVWVINLWIWRLSKCQNTTLVYNRPAMRQDRKFLWQLFLANIISLTWRFQGTGNCTLSHSHYKVIYKASALACMYLVNAAAWHCIV